MLLRQLAFAVMCLPLVALAQVYKWVDDKGVTHYDASPPPNAKSREIQVRDPTGGPGTKPRAAGPSVQEQEAAFRQRQIEREQADAKEARDRTQLQMRCRSLRSNIDDMKNARRVYHVDEKGERVYMGDEARQALIAKREADYNRSCP